MATVKTIVWSIVGYNPKRGKKYFLTLLAWNLGVYLLDWLLYLSLLNLANGKSDVILALPYVYTVSWVAGSLAGIVPVIFKTKRAVRFNQIVQAVCLRSPLLLILMAVAR